MQPFFFFLHPGPPTLPEFNLTLLPEHYHDLEGKYHFHPPVHCLEQRIYGPFVHENEICRDCAHLLPLGILHQESKVQSISIILGHMIP